MAETCAPVRFFSSGSSLEHRISEDKVQDVLVRLDHHGGVPSVQVYKKLLHGCIKRNALAEAKLVHAHLVRNGLESDLYLSECVVDTLVRCGSLADGLLVLQRLSHRTVFVWTTIISGYCRAGRWRQALTMYRQMQEDGVQPNDYTFVSLLKACGSLGDLEEGKRIHADIQRHKRESHVFVGTTLVDMYAKCGSLADARLVFDQLSQRDLVSWNAMIAGYAQQEQGHQAFQLFEDMQEAGVYPNHRTFVSLLQACGCLAENEASSVLDGQAVKVQSLLKGRVVHAQLKRRGHEADGYVSNALVSMYAKCGSIADARQIFDKLSQRDVVSWNAIIAGYAQQEQGDRAFDLYEQMQKKGVCPNDRTFVSILQALGSLADQAGNIYSHREAYKTELLEQGKAIHAEAARRGYESDVFVSNALISMYAKCGGVRHAEEVFGRLSTRNVVSWSAMLAGYAQQGQGEKAFQLYEQMLEQGVSPDGQTFASTFQALATLAEREGGVLVNGTHVKLESLQKGRAVHAEAVKRGYESNSFVGNAILSMYAKCSIIKDARYMFDKLLERSVVSWSAILAAYAQEDFGEEALDLFGQMQEEGITPDNWTFVSASQACGSLAEKEEGIVLNAQLVKVESLHKGRAIHAEAVQSGYGSDIFLGNTLVSMYAKCGSITDAEQAFDMLAQRDVVSWNAMLAGYTQQEEGEKALKLYVQMKAEDVPLDDITYVCILEACSKVGSLNDCLLIHQDVANSALRCSPYVATALIHTYGKCGSMLDAQAVFDSLSEANAWCWTALIAGYARQGRHETVIQRYEEMCLAGVEPNGVTFLSLLSACSNAGMVDKGLEYFECMTREHGISPTMEHYVCLVDLLARAGLFSKVEDLVLNMPMEPTLAMCLSLLGACRKHGNVALGRRAFDCACRIHPNHAAAYILMSNIYSHAGMWDSVTEIERLRWRAGARKKPGQSWIEHEQEVHTFVAGDISHRTQEMLYASLRKISLQLTEVGHVSTFK